MMNIILASTSPRRKELLEKLNINFSVMNSNSDETLIKDLSLEEQSKHLALNKAKSVFNKTSGDRIVIGADTIIFKNGVYYGKPTSYANAFDIILDLMDDTHQVSTGLAILIEKNGNYYEFLDCDISNVHIVKMSSDEINNWLSLGKHIDKAGAYSVQDEFSKFIDRIDGNYNSIVGLPLHLVYKIISNFI
ncbi:MAG: septum formation protein Maf [Clostridia bacterium]|nr:septum formation protein Maf [Clostridia bacterium]